MVAVMPFLPPFPPSHLQWRQSWLISEHCHPPLYMKHLLQQYWKHGQNERVAAPLGVIYVWMCSLGLCFYYSQSVLKLVGHPLCVAISGIILQIYACIYVCLCTRSLSFTSVYFFLSFPVCDVRLLRTLIAIWIKHHLHSQTWLECIAADAAVQVHCGRH